MPSGQHPFNQLRKGMRRRSKGSLADALKETWLIIRVAGAGRDLALEEENLDEIYRFCSLGINGLQAYAKLYPQVELEAEMKLLKEQVAQLIEEQRRR